MYTTNFEKLSNHLRSGRVYRRDNLTPYSKAIDRDLAKLTQKGVLKKISAGLYYREKKSRFGNLPPDDKLLVKAFLRDNKFLLLSWNEYNALGIGFTQLYNHVVVYNHKRHGVFKLDNKKYDFRRPSHGFPAKLTPVFLIVDLLNNLNDLAEDAEILKKNIKTKLSPLLLKQASHCANKYGKIATKNFFKEIAQ